MTCIVGYIDKAKDRVLIGADSAGVSGYDITIRNDSKVFKNGDFIIGCTTSFRMIQLLRFSFVPPRVYDKDIYEYMCTDFIEEVRKCFKDGGYLQKFEDGNDAGGQFLVGYKNRLFTIDNDFQVGEAKQGYDSVGCGVSYALGSIYTNKKKDSRTIVLDALKTAEYFSAGVVSPFIIENT